MQLQQIVVDPEEARAICAEYEAAFRKTRDEEDRAMAQAYRAASRGLPIIELSKVLQAGGTFDLGDPRGAGLPKLAVARADHKLVRVSGGRHHDTTFVSGGAEITGRYYTAPKVRRLVGDRHVRVPEFVLPHASYNDGFRSHGATMVPSIPPRYRPARPRLSALHVLWEVEEWTPVPPVDPALIRHVRGDLWTVLAVWDLSELERAVLTERARG